MKQHHFKNLIMIVLIFCLTIGVFAQENQSSQLPKMKKHEFNVSVGVFTTLGTIPPIWLDDYYPLFSYYSRDKNTHKIGTVNFEYLNSIKSFYSLGFSISYNYERTINQYDYLNRPYSFDYHILSFFISNRIYYIHRSNYSIYSSIYLGWTFYLNGSIASSYEYIDLSDFRNFNYPDIHLCLFGLSLNRKIPLNFEIGFGTQGIIKFGLKF